MMKTVEWNGTQWCLVEWTDTGFLTRSGRIVALLKSRAKINAETEARLQGWF